jgi:serine/threonine protein kinase
VYLAIHRPTGARVAVKLIETERIVSMSDRISLAREVSILQHLDHPFIGKVFCVGFESDHVVVIQEFLPHGTLLDLLTRDGPLPDNRIRCYLMQLVSAIDYLHNVRRMAHRDLKLENIMLDHLDNLKVIDFGLSRALSDGDSCFTTPCGYPPYLAPEIITDG